MDVCRLGAVAAKRDSGAEPAQAQTSRRSARAVEMRTRLLDAAESLYASEGPTALTNRRIGDEAATTTQSIYTYFGSRDALLEAMYQRAIDGAEEIITMASAIADQEPDEADVVDAFKQAARHYREFCLQHPGRFRMIRGAAADVGLSEAASALRERVVDAVSRFGRSGTGEQTTAYESRVHLTIAAMHGFFEAELEGFISDAQQPAELFDELVLRCLVPYEHLPQHW